MPLGWTGIKDEFLNKLRRNEGIVSRVEESPEGGYTARGIGISIYTQGDNLDELKATVLDAVRCHYEDEKRRIIHLRIVREEVNVA